MLSFRIALRNCRPCGSDVNTKASDTLVGRLRKSGMYMCIRRFFYCNYFYLFIFLECLWGAKMLKIEGQLAFNKPHLFGQIIFHQEPVLDQTMINLQYNTIGLKFLDFNRILF